MGNQLIYKKICLLGMFGVGKTSLVRRFVYNRFDDAYLTTVGVKVSQKILPPVKNSQGRLTQFTFLIWDIAGFEEASQRTKNYFVGAAGALVVADLTRPQTTEALPTILETFAAVAPDAAVVFLGNKTDLLPELGDQAQALEAFARQQNGPVLLTSAKTGLNVEKAFLQLAKNLAE